MNLRIRFHWELIRTRGTILHIFIVPRSILFCVGSALWGPLGPAERDGKCPPFRRRCHECVSGDVPFHEVRTANGRSMSRLAVGESTSCRWEPDTIDRGRRSYVAQRHAPGAQRCRDSIDGWTPAAASLRHNPLRALHIGPNGTRRGGFQRALAQLV